METRAARIAVVGAGLMGRWHAHAAERLGAEVAAVVDVSRDAAETLASRHGGAAAFSDLSAALARTRIDVVHVCTPVESHAVLAETALAAGCHALVEKPLALSVAQTEAVLAGARDRRLMANPVHQLPFQPGFRRVLERRGRLGDLVRVAYRTCSAGGWGHSGEERRRILLEILPHPVSLLHRLFGDSFARVELDVMRFTDDDLDLTGGLDETRLDVSISLRGRPTRNELEVVGTEASAFADLFHGFGFLEIGRVSRPAKIVRPFRLGAQFIAYAGMNVARRTLRSEPAYPGLRELVGRFHAATLTRGEAPIPDAETLAAARLMERAASGHS